MAADLRTRTSGLSLTLLLLAPAAMVGENGPLDEFLAQYSRIESLHMKASAIVSLETPEGPRVGSVQIEYWESGGRYRLVSRSERGLKLVADTETAFDGESFQLWLRDENILSLARQDSKVPTSAMENPFFLPVQFLRSDGRLGEGALRLADVVRASAVVERPQQGDAELIFGDAYRVVTQTERGKAVPRVIQQRATGSAGHSLIELRDYRPYGPKGLLFPAGISVQVVDPKAGTLRTEILISTLEFDLPLPASTFVIAGDDETRIWNSDLERFEDDSGMPGEPGPGG
ncbi:MAG: hypothetical protein AAF604_17855 [Acidobacteriota bacterium]